MNPMRSALRWTWAALMWFLVIIGIHLFIGVGTPLGGILSPIGFVLVTVAGVKTTRAGGLR